MSRLFITKAKFVGIVTGVFMSQVLFGQQCNTDNHSNHIRDSWKSCSKSESPNSVRGSTHWIMYDLGETYLLGATKIWNYNVDEQLDNGMNEIVIDVSIDGESWSEASAFILPRATGNINYSGIDGPNLQGVQARFVLITSLSNHGGTCSGLSQLLINVQPDQTTSVQDILAGDSGIEFFPNPTEGHFIIRGTLADYNLRILDSMGNLHQDIRTIDEEINIDISSLPAGAYFVHIQHLTLQQVEVQLIIKQ